VRGLDLGRLGDFTSSRAQWSGERVQQPVRQAGRRVEDPRDVRVPAAEDRVLRKISEGCCHAAFGWRRYSRCSPPRVGLLATRKPFGSRWPLQSSPRAQRSSLRNAVAQARVWTASTFIVSAPPLQNREMSLIERDLKSKAFLRIVPTSRSHRRWSEPLIAPEANPAPRSFRITHPF
jgi:hypothetical protein